LLGGLANNALDRGQLDDAQRFFEQSLVSIRVQGLRDQEAVSLYSLSRIAQYRGDFAAAHTYAEQSLAITREIGQRWGETASLRRLGDVAFARGDLDMAEERYSEALSLSRELGSRSEAASTLANLSKIERLRGRHAEAAQLLAEATQIVEQTSDAVIAARWIEVQAGRLALDQGDVDGALAAADRILADEGVLTAMHAADAYHLRGCALVAVGEFEQASMALEAGYAFAEKSSDRVRRARLAAALGRLSLERERADLALGYLGLARDAAPDTYEVLALTAALASREGDREAAANLIGEAKRRAGGLWTAENERLRLALVAETLTGGG
jgi:tetratricopeptide (TPR) repeat protein